MRVYRNEVERLKAARALASARFPRFGVNKTQETVRLLYEISKRDNVTPAAILRTSPSVNFAELKECLLHKRFPHTSLRGEPSKAFLPKLSLDPDARLIRGRGTFNPKRIMVEESARNSDLERRLRDAFPRAVVSEIPSLKAYLSTQEEFGIADYNSRRNTVFVIRARHDFFKRCPCTNGAVPCGYHIFNLGFGCIYECSYCYLQEYANAPGIVLPANIEHFFDRFARYTSSPAAAAWRRGIRMRIGTGEFSDSLMLDHLTEYSLPIVEFFKRHQDALFEFKTKSARIDNLLKAPHAGNIVLSWSLNPQKIIDENEWYTAPLSARLDAAARSAEAGYAIGLHFDPVIHFEGWEKEYAGVIEEVFDTLQPQNIAWISIGTLRFRPRLKQIIENRFPDNTILDGELLPGYDRKLRYPVSTRHAVYNRLMTMLLKHSKKLPVYLCMEDRSMWRRLGLHFPFGGDQSHNSNHR
jgi:spore photoproduct lyase